jgi:hypothetical protein
MEACFQLLFFYQRLIAGVPAGRNLLLTGTFPGIKFGLVIRLNL